MALQLIVGISYLATVSAVWAQVPAQQLGERVESLTRFDHVYVTGNIDLKLVQSTDQVSNELRVRAERLDLEAVEDVLVEQVDRVLFIDAPRDGRYQVELVVGRLKELVFDGTGEITGEGIEGDGLLIEGRGDGDFDLRKLSVRDLVVVGTGQTRFRFSGTARHQSIELAGANIYAAHELQSTTSSVSASGQNDLVLQTSELLDVVVEGSGIVRYQGAPRVHQTIVGSGKVLRLPEVRTTTL